MWLASGCFLGNIDANECQSDAECTTAFGAGSRCSEGYCTEAQNQACQKTGEDGRACFSCVPTSTPEYQNACTDAACAPFDNKARLTKLNEDGSLPALP